MKLLKASNLKLSNLVYLEQENVSVKQINEDFEEKVTQTESQNKVLICWFRNVFKKRKKSKKSQEMRDLEQENVILKDFKEKNLKLEQDLVIQNHETKYVKVEKRNLGKQMKFIEKKMLDLTLETRNENHENLKIKNQVLVDGT